MARSAVREKRKKTLRLQWERMHRARRNNALRRLRSTFRRVRETIVFRFESRGIIAADPLDLLHRGELADVGNPIMVPQWRAMFASGIQFESDWITESQPSKRQQGVIAELDFLNAMETQALESTLSEPPPSIYVDLSPDMKSQIDSWIGNRRVGFWAKLEGVILAKVQKAIADGIKEGDTLGNLRKRIDRELTGLSKYAANRIARTETTAAMNYGGQLERSELDIEHKEWVATIDIRTRTFENSGYDHLNANGDVVKNGDFFIISGEKLLFPGDGDHGATAGNIIHCRCAAVASIDYNANKRPAAVAP